ncbi:ParB-like nuclease family protein [Actinocrispum wychmicini]|uniref:ParB-like nuclease family protein n=2 Tax=Actinocrispum wychmicini TaxID=1213861 RepID=A0A4R2JIR7_9PSEU|nr:ParB-like nuclease family protein [Actinocrispum wychmicini]
MVAPDFDMMPLARMSIDSLLPADSPRLAGLDHAHVRVLAESPDELPPIIVHRSTGRVIDGMHRLQAAVLHGETEVAVRLYDGDEREAFVLAVQTNIVHGLPLSLADRNAAAARIVTLYPEWSDRAIASCVGLAPKTVGAVRRRSGELGSDPGVRRGLDGRKRPVSSLEGRLTASRLLRERPNASLREIAEAAGIAPSTAMDVRNRLASGQHPVPNRPRGAVNDSSLARPRNQGHERPKPSAKTLEAALRVVRTDPSLRFNAAGRLLLRWLGAYPPGPVEWNQVVGSVPSHCVDLVVDLARRNADLLHEFAKELEERQCDHNVHIEQSRREVNQSTEFQKRVR